MVEVMNKVTLLGISIVISVGIIVLAPNTAYSDSDIQSEQAFEHIMAIDIHDQSTVVYSYTENPMICDVEYIPTENNSSETLVFSHSSVPHQAHIVKITNLLSNTEYEYQFVGELNEEKIYSEKMYFKTL